MKNRYAIIEPGPLRPEDLESLTWVDCEFKKAEPTFEELTWLLDPLFPNADGWERVAVNSFKGQADMFIDENGAGAAGHAVLPINEGATLIYWTATIMHELAADDARNRVDIDPVELRKRALIEAADRLTVAPEHRFAPQIHGRAVLFDDRVWF